MSRWKCWNRRNYRRKPEWWAALWPWLCLALVAGVTGYHLRKTVTASRPRPRIAAPTPVYSPPVAKPAPRKPAPQRAAAARAAQTERKKSAGAKAVAYRKTIVNGLPLHIVQVDLRSPDVRFAVATAGEGIGTRESWSKLVDRARPAAAITGTYFCTSSAIPVGSIIVGGEWIHRGYIGTAFTFGPEHGARIAACRPGREYDWSGCDTVLRAGPRLLTKGQKTLWPRDEGFRDPAVFMKKKRTAVALTKHGKLLFVAVEKPVLLRTLTAALRQLGAVDAMCLDGGKSTGLYVRGKTRVKPERALTNVLVVYDTTERYQRQAKVLNPSGAQVVQAPTGRPG